MALYIYIYDLEAAVDQVARVTAYDDVYFSDVIVVGCCCRVKAFRFQLPRHHYKTRETERAGGGEGRGIWGEGRQTGREVGRQRARIYV